MRNHVFHSAHTIIIIGGGGEGARNIRRFFMRFGESPDRRERPSASLLEVSKGGSLTQVPSRSQQGVGELVQG